MNNGATYGKYCAIGQGGLVENSGGFCKRNRLRDVYDRLTIKRLMQQIDVDGDAVAAPVTALEESSYV
jgi:hypothetical protein